MDIFIKLIDKSHFPWLLSNVFYADKRKPLGAYETKVIINLNRLKV